MSVFTSLIIILLAMLIQGFLELGPGVFACFYHHALGKTSAKKADDQSLSFILGTEICVALVFLISYIIVTFFITRNGPFSPIFFWVMSGIFLVEAIATFFFYFRPGTKKSTELSLPRSLAKSLIYHAENTKNRSSTIALGLVTCALELIFTFPLYIIASTAIFYANTSMSFVFIIAYIIIATAPLFAIRTFFRTDHNLVELQLIRIKKKLATRIIVSASFLALSIATLIIGFSL
ncbi:hypothetical protein IJI79_01455 [Candidatus Saccharibacteria bacterium]|nr:hypothetical protein [Candidatus Saccharibacteria bacterium]MBR0424148.1 hypothetical protein [Candidatus Saccharibacteria bacterium]